MRPRPTSPLRPALHAIGLCAGALAATQAQAQSLLPGPSDPSGFATVINLPAEALPGFLESIGGDAGDIQLNLSAGASLDAFTINGGGELNLLGGSLGTFSVNQGGVVNVTEGALTGSANVNNGGELNIAGGSLDGLIISEPGGELNLFGTDFSLNSAPIEGLTIGSTLTIDTRGVDLEGTLADGSPFRLPLNGTFVAEADFFPTGSPAFPGSTVTVTLVPEPGAVALLGAGGLLLGLRRPRCA